MTTKFILFLISILLASTSAFGQEKLYLQHQKKSNRMKCLNLEGKYHFQTANSTIKNEKIIDFTDSTISLFLWVKVKCDSTDSASEFYFIKDTVLLAFEDILLLKKDRFANKKWLEPFLYFAMGGALGIVFLPVAAIDEGKQGIRDWALFEAVVFSICAPPIFIGTRKTRYNLEKKWTLTTEQ